MVTSSMETPWSKNPKLYRVGTQALQQTLDLLDYGAVRKVGGLPLRAIMCYCFGQGNTSIIAHGRPGGFFLHHLQISWINDFPHQAITDRYQAPRRHSYFSFSGAMRELSIWAGLVQKTEAS